MTDFLYSSPFNAEIRIIPEGGLAVRLVNKTGAPSIKGSVVMCSEDADFACMLSPADDDEAIGAIYDSGVPDGDRVWVVVAGKGDVLLQNETASAHGDWVGTSTTAAGRAITSNEPAGLTGHDRELGHCVQSVSAGTDQLARIVFHFR